MNDSLFMCCGQSMGDLQCIFDRAFLAQRRSAYSFAQRLPSNSSEMT